MAKFSETFKKYNPRDEAQWKTWNGAEFLIAPTGNKHQQQMMLEEFTLQEASEFESKGPMVFSGLRAGEALKRVYSLYSKSIIFDWKLEDDNDKPMKFTPEKCLQLMTENLEFSNWVLVTSQEIAIEKNKAEEALEKK